MTSLVNARHGNDGSASSDPATPYRRSHAIALALGTFAIGTDAFVLAGVLPSIAKSLHVTLAAAGQLVTVFSLAYALASPVLSALTANWSRRLTLVAALIAFALGNAMTAVIPSFALVLMSRIVAAAGAGLFTANATATAAVLAGSQNRGRAIALVVFGLTSSLVFGAPLGAAIGNILGWRMTMWFVTSLGLLSGAVVFLSLPDIRESGESRLSERLAPLRRSVILYGLFRALLVFTGIYMPYTYISVVYAPLIRTQPQWLGALLLFFGIAGTIGNLLAGRMVDWRGPVPIMIGASTGLAVTFLLVPSLNAALPSALVGVMLSGLFSFALNTPQQHFLISHAQGKRISLVTSLYQSTIYAAVSLSGAIGAVVIRAGWAKYLTTLAVTPILLFMLMTWLQGRMEMGHDPSNQK